MPAKTKSAPSPFASLQKLRSDSAPAPLPSAPSLRPAAPTSPAAAALAQNLTSVPVRRRALTREYPKINIRTAEDDNKRTREIVRFLNENGRSTGLSAAVRVALHLIKLDTKFLKTFEKFEDVPKDGPRLTINLMPTDAPRLQTIKGYLIDNNKGTANGSIARAAMHAIPLDDAFLEKFDEFQKQDGRRRRR